jgi:hypothetical protein
VAFVGDAASGRVPDDQKTWISAYSMKALSDAASSMPARVT